MSVESNEDIFSLYGIDPEEVGKTPEEIAWLTDGSIEVHGLLEANDPREACLKCLEQLVQAHREFEADD